MMKTQRILPALLWLILTLALSYAVDTWLRGANARLLENTNSVFLDVWISVLGRLGTGISLLLLYSYLSQGERATWAGALLIILGVALMVYPSVVFLLQFNGTLSQSPAFYYPANSLTGISGTLAAGIGILTLVRDPS